MRNFVLFADNSPSAREDHILHSDTPLTCKTSYCMIRTSTQSNEERYASDYPYIQGGHMYQLDFDKPIHVYFSGIGGISMSGLAQILPTAPLLPSRTNWLRTASESLSARRRKTSRPISISSSLRRRSVRTIRSTSQSWKTIFRT